MNASIHSSLLVTIKWMHQYTHLCWSLLNEWRWVYCKDMLDLFSVLVEGFFGFSVMIKLHSLTRGICASCGGRIHVRDEVCEFLWWADVLTLGIITHLEEKLLLFLPQVQFFLQNLRGNTTSDFSSTGSWLLRPITCSSHYCKNIVISTVMFLYHCTS